MTLVNARDNVLAFQPGNAPKLTAWAREPTVPELRADLESSRSSHDTVVANVTRWNDLIKAQGRFKPKHAKGRSSVQPKLAKQQVEWRISALSEPLNSTAKLFSVSPRSGGDGPNARQNEIVLNWQWDTRINRQVLIDQYVRATCNNGSSVLMVGWCRITRDEWVEAPVWAHDEADPLQTEALNAAYLQRNQDPDGYEATHPPEMKRAVDYLAENGQATVVSRIGTERVKQTRVVANHPTVQVINLKNFYWDPSCGDDFDQAKFAIRSFETSKADMLKDGRYKNLEHVNWESATPIADSNYEQNSRDPSFQFADRLRKKVVAYEYYGWWDVEGDEVLVPVICTWVGDTLVRCERSPFPGGFFPFIPVPYTPVENSIFGEPDAELLEDHQQIVGAVMRGAIDLMGRSANAQTLTAKGLFDPVNKRRFEQGLDAEINPSMPIEAAIKTMTFPEIPGAVMQMLQLQTDQAEALTGVKSFSGGLSGNALGDTATGIRGALDAASKREAAILRRLAGGIVKAGRMIVAMNALFLSEEETIRVTETQFVQVRREDLEGEFDLKVDISTAEADNAKAQDLAFMLQTIGPKGDPKMTMEVLAEIARLKRMPELEAKLRAWQPPPPDPLVQQKLMLEIQLLQIQIQKAQSEIELNFAKGQKLQVEADQIDLDVVEQETGTKQARDLERLGAQGKANQDLEVTKALGKPRKEGEGDPKIEAMVGWNQMSKDLSDPRRNNAPPPPAPGPMEVNPVEIAAMGPVQ
jgi:hypothetical protein